MGKTDGRMKRETLAIHAGYDGDPTTKAVAVPIYQTVAFEFDSAEHGAAPVSYTHLDEAARTARRGGPGFT